MIGGYFNTGTGGKHIGGYQAISNSYSPAPKSTVLKLSGNTILIINDKAITIA